MSTDTTSDLTHQRDVDSRLAPAMFGLSIAFLMVLAALIVAKIDIPRVVELSLLDSGRELPTQAALMRLQLAEEVSWNLTILLLCFWPFFIAESIYYLLLAKSDKASRKQQLLHLGSAIAPPIRMGIPSLAWQGRLWIPVLHWIHPGKQTTHTLSRYITSAHFVSSRYSRVAISQANKNSTTSEDEPYLPNARPGHETVSGPADVSNRE